MLLENVAYLGFIQMHRFSFSASLSQYYGFRIFLIIYVFIVHTSMQMYCVMFNVLVFMFNQAQLGQISLKWCINMYNSIVESSVSKKWRIFRWLSYSFMKNAFPSKRIGTKKDQAKSNGLCNSCPRVQLGVALWGSCPMDRKKTYTLFVIY